MKNRTMTTTGSIITTVLEKLKIEYHFVDNSEVVLAVTLAEGFPPHYIIYNILGINSESDTKLCADKAYTYELLSKCIEMPKTQSYLDPNGRYREYRQFSSQEKIVQDIKKNFQLPLIVKKNTGSMGSGVHKCETWEQVASAVASIFCQDSSSYDYVCVVQTAILIRREWRVLMYKGKLQFMYEKDVSAATFKGNLSPLHWEDSTANLVSDEALQQQIQHFLDPVFEQWQLPYGGFDVVEDTTGKLWLIEVNSHPAFAVFLRDNDPEPLKQMYRIMLKDLQTNYQEKASYETNT